jgi:ankyrin repeat protein
VEKEDSDFYNLSAILFAVHNERATAKIINKLVALGADTNAKTDRVHSNISNGTPIMHAVWADSPAALDALAENGADVNAREGRHGTTALMMAAALTGQLFPPHAPAAFAEKKRRGFRECCETVHALLRHRAKASLRDHNDLSAVEYAIKTTGIGAFVQLDFSADDFDIHARFGPKKQTALMYAAENGHQFTVLALSELGARTEDRDADGKTALFYALANEAPKEAIKALLEMGADPFAEDARGLSVSDHAEEMGLSILKECFPDGENC